MRQNGKNTPVFDEVVSDLKVLLSDEFEPDQQHVADLQKRILVKTSSNYQESSTRTNNKARKINYSVSSWLSRERFENSINSLLRYKRSIPAFLVAFAVMGFMLAQLNKTGAVTHISESDLVFQELWLAEDELLFGSETL